MNHRSDEYGGSTENRLRLASEIISGIKSSTKSNFIVDYRLGSCTPNLSDGIEVAQLLEKYGVDIIHASHGGVKGINAEVPQGCELNSILYMGTEIKKHVKVPVIVVNQIQNPERANKLVEARLPILWPSAAICSPTPNGQTKPETARILYTASIVNRDASVLPDPNRVHFTVCKLNPGLKLGDTYTNTIDKPPFLYCFHIK
jgi:hypothetical protein